MTGLDIGIVVGLVALTIGALWLVRRDPTHQLAGWTVRGEGPPGEAELLQTFNDFIDMHPSLAKLTIANKIVIEWVKLVWTPSAPGYNGHCVAESIERRKPQLWNPAYTAVVVSRVDKAGFVWKHAKLSGLAHGLFLHVIPELQGRGRCPHGPQLENADPIGLALFAEFEAFVAQGAKS